MHYKPTCILLIKSERRWAHHLVRKLSLRYNVKVIKAATTISDKGYDGLVSEINKKINDENAKTIFLALDFFYGLDIRFIVQIDPTIVKALVTFDDITLHEINSINAVGCDIVLTADPISCLKYKEKGIVSEYFCLESSGSIYRNLDLKKTTDVLFFGNASLADRRRYVDYLKKRGINICVVGEGTNFVGNDDLTKKICEAKVVINFSKSGIVDAQQPRQSVYVQYWQLKGRIVEVGLCGTVCISEYSPSLRLLFTENEVPMFRGKEELYEIIVELLEDDNKREAFAENLYRKTVTQYEDGPLMERIGSVLDQVKVDKISSLELPEFDSIPYWYHRLTMRSRMQQLSGRSLQQLKEVINTMVSNDQRIIIKIALLIDVLSWSIYKLINFKPPKKRQ